MKRLLSLAAALSVIALGVYDAPAYANGTVKKSAPAKKRVHKRSQKAIPCPCPAPVAECPSPVPPCPEVFFKTGAYAGAQIGYNYMRGKINNTFAPVGAAAHSDTGTKTDNGIIGELFFGWRYFYHSGISFGAEVAANIESNGLRKDITHPTNLFKMKFERTFSIVPAITLGRTFQDRWHFFGKLGLGISRFKTKIHNNATQQKFSKEKTRLGVVPSLGLEYGVNNYISLLGTVTYEYYSNESRTFQNVDGTGGQMTNKMRRVQYISPKIGLVAKF